MRTIPEAADEDLFGGIFMLLEFVWLGYHLYGIITITSLCTTLVQQQIGKMLRIRTTS